MGRRGHYTVGCGIFVSNYLSVHAPSPNPNCLDHVEMEPSDMRQHHHASDPARVSFRPQQVFFSLSSPIFTLQTLSARTLKLRSNILVRACLEVERLTKLAPYTHHPLVCFGTLILLSHHQTCFTVRTDSPKGRVAGLRTNGYGKRPCGSNFLN